MKTITNKKIIKFEGEMQKSRFFALIIVLGVDSFHKEL